MLKAARSVLKSLEWTRDAADRLAFAEVLASNETWTAPMDDTFKLLDIEPGSVQGLDAYLTVSAGGRSVRFQGTAWLGHETRAASVDNTSKLMAGCRLAFVWTVPTQMDTILKLIRR